MKTAQTDRIIFILIVIFFSLILGCKEDIISTEIIEPEKFIWNEHPDYRYSAERVYNLVAGERFLNLYGEHTLSKININNESDHCFGYHSNVNYKFPASELLYFLGNPLHSRITIRKFSCIQQSSYITHDFSTDSLFEYFEYDNTPRGISEVVGFDGEFTFLLPAKGKIDHPMFYLVVLDTTHYSPHYNDYNIELDTISRIIIKEEIGTRIGVGNINHIDGSFFVSISHGLNQSTYKINHDFTYEKVVDKIFQQYFEYQGDLYGVYGADLFRADLSRTNWEEVQTNIPPPVSFFTFKEIEEEVYFYGAGIVGKLVLGEKGVLGIDYFNNTGLIGSYITDIDKFNDKIYISTLSGLFWAELDKLEYY